MHGFGFLPSLSSKCKKKTSGIQAKGAGKERLAGV